MTQPKMICMLSDMHGLYDDRIYWKECLSLKEHGYNVIHIGIGDKSSDTISEHGIRLITLVRNKYSNNVYIDILIRNIFFRNQLYRNIFKTAKNLNSDYYTIHDLKSSKLINWFKKSKLNSKITYCIHESYPDKIRDYNKSNLLFNLLKRIYAFYIEKWEIRNSALADHIVVFDDALYDKFTGIFSKEKVKVIYNFTSLFPESEYEQVDKIYDLIYIGGLTEYRGILNILKAVALCKKEFPNIRLLLLGMTYDKYFDNRMIRLIKDLSLDSNVEYKKWVPYQEVKMYLSKSKIGLVLLLPIPKYLKNIPIKQFEYMAFGLPVIGSDLPPISKFIKPVEAGILVDPEIIEMISDAIIQLLTNSKRYNTMSENAKKAAFEKYNWKNEELKLLTLYNNE
ncbi:MAG: glycosyltransferase family 4 protein [Bacteroidales bacterium]